MAAIASFQADIADMFSLSSHCLEPITYADLKADIARQCNNLEHSFFLFRNFYKKTNWMFFAPITNFIPKIKDVKSFGEWVFGKSAPYVRCENVVLDFVEKVFDFVKKYPKYNLPDDFMRILYDNGIDWNDQSMHEADYSILDAQGILALIFGVISADRFSDGTLVSFFDERYILLWIRRLEEIEESIFDEELTKLYNIDDVDIQNESLEDIIRGIYEED